MQREIWFRCITCRRESYCGAEFDQWEDPPVLCPFCGQEMNLDAVRLDRRGQARSGGASNEPTGRRG